MIRGKSFSIWMKAKMTKRNRGRWLERMVAALLIEAGWSVHLVQSAVAFNPGKKQYYAKKQDIFGSDILAMKPGRVFLFIQVTADTNIGRKIRTFRSYPFPWDVCRVLIFQAKKRKGRWKFKVGRVEQTGVDWADECLLEDIFGDLFWEKRDLFWAGRIG